MAHVWNVIDGDIYVSKNGDDVAGDGSMSAPYASINKATDVGIDGNKIVIGSGVWQEARGTSTNLYVFEGDGEVIFDYLGVAKFVPISKISSPSETVVNIYFRNNDFYSALFYSGWGATFNIDYAVKFVKCKFDWAGYVGVGGGAYAIANCAFERCLINKMVIVYTDYTKYGLKLIGCTVKFLNVNWTGGTYKLECHGIENCIIDEYFDEYLNSTGIIKPINPQYNFINKTTGVNNLFSESSVYNNTFGILPKFNNAEIGDFTLQPNSPCLYAGKNNSTIGAYGLGYSFDANSSEFTEEGGAIFSQTTGVNDIIRTSQTINGITRFLFQLTAGHTTGNVESAWIDLQAIRYLLITRLFANIIYNSSGVATSRPDNLEAAGEKAVYYDFELKYCNEESEKAAATFKNVIWNKAVTIDNSDRGNADGAFVASEAKYISARFVKIKLYMTEA